MKAKLAEALLRRKELQEKVDQLKGINAQKDLLEVKAARKNVTDNVDDVIVQVPLLLVSQVTHAYDWHAKQLRRVDAAIQQANWDTEIELDDQVMADYVDPPKPKR
jgi:hypothetical protein